MRPIVIVGAGAIGGTIGAYMARAGLPVHFVDLDRDHVIAVQHKGLRVNAFNESFTVAPPIDTPDTFAGSLHTVFLCTKALHTESAMEWIAPRLEKNGFVVSLQNGLNELVIERFVGRERTVGAFINYFTDLVEPGVIAYGGPGAVVFGELNGERTERLETLQAWTEPFIRPVLSANIWGYLWSKLAYGAMLFATATTDATMAECIDHPQFRPVLLALAQEIVDLAAKQEIELYGFDGWDPAALGHLEAENAMMDNISAMMQKNGKVRSGVWRDLAVRKRKTEIDPQYGPVLQTAQRLDVPMPMLTQLVSIVHQLETDALTRDWSNLEALADCMPNP